MRQRLATCLLVAATLGACVVRQPLRPQTPAVVTADLAARIVVYVDPRLVVAPACADQVEAWGWRETLPRAVRDELRAAGFRVVADRSEADAVATVPDLSVHLGTFGGMAVFEHAQLALANRRSTVPMGNGRLAAGEVTLPGAPAEMAPLLARALVDKLVRSPELRASVEAQAPAAASPAPVQEGDRVALRDGTELRGRVLERRKGSHVVVELPEGRVMLVAMSALDELSSSPHTLEPAVVTLSSGRTIAAGVVQVDTGKSVTLRLPGGAELRLPWSQVSELRSAAR